MSEKDCLKTICKLALEKSDKFSKQIYLKKILKKMKINQCQTNVN